MKQIIFLLLLICALARQGFSQAPTQFTFDSIYNPPYICQFHVFNVEVFGVKSSGSIQLSSQNYLVSNDTVYARFYFVGGLGTPATQPLYQNQVIPAPINFGVYKIVAQGFYNGQLHAQKTSLIGICAGISGSWEKIAEPAIKIFPNPASDQAIVSLPPGEKETQLLLLDATGRAVFFRELPASATEATFHLQHIPAGIYQFRIKTGHLWVTRKLVKI